MASLTGDPRESRVTTAMILAAGRGARLESMRLGVPKALVEIGGCPLLQMQLDYLAREGIERAVINAHHRAAAISAFVHDYQGPVKLTVLTEPKLLGTAGGVRNALQILGETSFFVLYGDVVIDHPLAPMARVHRAQQATATLAVYESEAVEGKGTVLVDEEGWITRFAEKDSHVRTPALVNAGLYLLEPTMLIDVPPDVESDFGRNVFPTALMRGSRLAAYRLPGPVIDVGTPAGLAAARARASGSLLIGDQQAHRVEQRNSMLGGVIRLGGNKNSTRADSLRRRHVRNRITNDRRRDKVDLGMIPLGL